MTPSGPEKSHSDGVHQFGGHRFHPPDLHNWSYGNSPPGRATLPTACLLHRFPGFDGVVAKHSPDDWLTTTAQRSGLDDHPLGMSRGRVIREAADLSLLSVFQPADTLFRWVPFNLWAVLVRHGATLANQSADRSQRCFVGLLI